MNITFNQFKINRNEIKTIQQVKNYSYGYDKRVVVRNSEYDVDSLPYGY